MDKRELAYAKQTIPSVKDWDDFQAVIRSWARLLRPLPEWSFVVSERKKIS